METDNSKGLKSLANEETSKVVGLKQTMRALEAGSAKVVYIALDADKKITSKVKELADKKKVKVITTYTMEELGSATNIKVGAATVTELNN